MRLSLLGIRGVPEGKEIPVQHPRFCIGRDESCELRYENRTVSRRHAAILVRQGRVLVCDLGSRNGTFVNEVPVTGEREVRHDDRLRIGPLEFRIQVRPTAGVYLGREVRADVGSEENTARIRSGSPDPEMSSPLNSSAGLPECASAGRDDLLKKYLRRAHQ